MSQQYNTVVNALEQFSANHLSLKRFKCSFFEQMDNFSTSENSFPILYAIPNDISFEDNIDVMSFRVYCVDVLQKDRSNEQTILNETLLILRDLNNWFKQNDYNNLNVLNNPRAIPVNNFLTEFTTGWYIDIDVEVEGETNDCSIPFSNNFILTGITCDTQYVNQFLTCDTLLSCDGFIDLDNRVTTLESIVYTNNQLISGSVSYLSGLTFDITPLTYIIGGVSYSIGSSSQVTVLSSGTYDRIDTIYADISGNTGVIIGDESTNPLKPSVDPQTQVELSFVTIPASGSLTFSGTSNYYSRFTSGGTISNGFIWDDGISGVNFMGKINTAINIISPAGYYYPSLVFYNNGGNLTGSITGYGSELYINGGLIVHPNSINLPHHTPFTLLYTNANKYVLPVTIGSNLSFSTGGTLSVTGLTTCEPTTNIQASTTSLTPNITLYSDEVITTLSTGLTINAPTGTPVNGQTFIIRIKDNGTVRTLTWDSIYRFSLNNQAPANTTINKTAYFYCKYNSTDTKWDVMWVNNF